MLQNEDDKRSGEVIQIYILHTDLPIIDIGTICIDCSSDKDKMWSAPQAFGACGRYLMPKAVIATQINLHIANMRIPSRAYTDVSTSILLALEKTIFAPDTAVLCRNER